MSTLTQHRKRRLAALVADKPYLGNNAEFARRAGLSKGRVTQLLDPEKSFGELSAQKIAAKLRLGLGYFEKGFDGDQSDQEAIPSLSVEALYCALLIDKLPALDLRLELQAIIQKEVLDRIPKAYTEPRPDVLHILRPTDKPEKPGH